MATKTQHRCKATQGNLCGARAHVPGTDRAPMRSGRSIRRRQRGSDGGGRVGGRHRCISCSLALRVVVALAQRRRAAARRVSLHFRRHRRRRHRQRSRPAARACRTVIMNTPSNLVPAQVPMVWRVLSAPSWARVSDLLAANCLLAASASWASAACCRRNSVAMRWAHGLISKA